MNTPTPRIESVVSMRTTSHITLATAGPWEGSSSPTPFLCCWWALLFTRRVPRCHCGGVGRTTGGAHGSEAKQRVDESTPTDRPSKKIRVSTQQFKISLGCLRVPKADLEYISEKQFANLTTYI